MKPFKELLPKIGKAEIGDYILHGDVVLIRVEALPEDFEAGAKEPNNALAYGELTGHVHQLQGTEGVDFQLRVKSPTERHLRVVNPVSLKHQEHGPIIIMPGDYKVGVQREYDPYEKLIRQVAD